MALIACRECGGQVSTLAAACPACGAPIAPPAAPRPAPAPRQGTNPWMIIGWIILLLLLLPLATCVAMVGGLAMTDLDRQPAPQQQTR